MTDELDDAVYEAVGFDAVAATIHAIGEAAEVAADRRVVEALDARSQRMISRTPKRTVTLCIFDVLWLDGIDCSQLPYTQRRQVLEMLELTGPTWCTLPSFAGEDADALLDACSQLGQEGIVLKKLDSRYLPGVRSKAGANSRQTAASVYTCPGIQRLPPELTPALRYDSRRGTRSPRAV